MRIKKTLIILAGLFILFTGAQTVLAIDAGGLDKTADAAFGAGQYSKTSVQGITGNVIGAALTFVGVLFLILMIYGGIIWMMARGNEQQSKKALDTIIAAVIGLIIVLGAYAFTTFIFTSVQDKTVGSGKGICSSDKFPAPVIDCSGTTCGSYATSDTCPSECCEWK